MSQKVPKNEVSGKSTKAKLIEMKELLDDGLIIQEQFNEKQKEILEKM